MATTAQSNDLVELDPMLVQPVILLVDRSLPVDRARHMVRIGQLLYTFWHTGDPAFLDRAIDPSFIDRTLPPGRPQGPEGPRRASVAFRSAVPDLTCELSELLVLDVRLAVRLRFRGHFTGTFNGVSGQGQTIDFVAFDIQHVGEDRIVEDWHLEDNLTFMEQAGLVAIAGTDA